MPLKRREVFDEIESEGESEAEQVTEVSKEIENLEPVEDHVIEEEHEEEISSTDNETEHNTVPNTPVAASKPASSWLSTLTGLFSPFVQGYGKRERRLSAEHTDDEGKRKVYLLAMLKSLKINQPTQKSELGQRKSRVHHNSALHNLHVKNKSKFFYYRRLNSFRLRRRRITRSMVKSKRSRV
jgi:hypothetical protein